MPKKAVVKSEEPKNEQRRVMRLVVWLVVLVIVLVLFILFSRPQGVVVPDSSVSDLSNVRTMTGNDRQAALQNNHSAIANQLFGGTESVSREDRMELILEDIANRQEQ